MQSQEEEDIGFPVSELVVEAKESYLKGPHTTRDAQHGSVLV